MGIRVGVGRDGQGEPGKVGEMEGQIWEWVLEGPLSSSQRVERGDTESCDTHRLLLLFGWVQRLPRGGRGRREGRAPRQGKKARKEPGQERKGKRGDEER